MLCQCISMRPVVMRMRLFVCMILNLNLLIFKLFLQIEFFIQVFHFSDVFPDGESLNSASISDRSLSVPFMRSLRASSIALSCFSVRGTILGGAMLLKRGSIPTTHILVHQARVKKLFCKIFTAANL